MDDAQLFNLRCQKKNFKYLYLNAIFRILFAGARNGHFPGMLSLIQMNQLSPVSSLIFMVIHTSKNTDLWLSIVCYSK